MRDGGSERWRECEEGVRDGGSERKGVKEGGERWRECEKGVRERE